MGQLITGETYQSLKTLPDEHVDLGITSPPYNKQEKNKGELVTNVVYDTFKDKLPESEYQANQIHVLDEIYRVTKGGGSFFYNHKIRWEKGDMIHPMDWLRGTKWCIRQEIIWDRIIAGNIRGWRFWQVEERIYWLYKPVGNNKIGKELASKDAKMTSIWRHMPENNNPHPAPFPIWLPARIILSMFDEGKTGTILDPYAGSGTTCVAAKLLGHDYIGIDMSEEYIKHAQNRLDSAYEELGKIEKEKKMHVVEKTSHQRKNHVEDKSLQLPGI